MILECKGIIPFSSQQTNLYVAALYRDKDSVFFGTYTFSCFLYLVAFVSGYLSDKLRARINELELKSLELEQLKLDTKAILTHLPGGLIALDLFGNVLYLNTAAKTLLKLTEGNYEGKNIKDILAPSFAPVLKWLETLYWRSDTTDEIKKELEFTIHGNKSVLFFVFSVLRLKGVVRGFLVLFEDITEQKRKAAYLKSLEKLAALGRLSFGLAHELKNPLASIQGSAELLKSSGNNEQDTPELLSLIIDESDRLSAILDNFLQFAQIGKERKLRLFPIPIKKLISEIVTEVQNHPSFHDAIKIKLHFPKDEIWVKGDINSLKQVFLNLLLNAVESIEDTTDENTSGQIVISSTKEVQDLDTHRNFIGISITDTGKGIDSDGLSKLFEPLYTTKKGGVGLGLSIAQRLVNEMQGYIEVDSKPGKGSKFTVFLISD